MPVYIHTQYKLNFQTATNRSINLCNIDSRLKNQTNKTKQNKNKKNPTLKRENCPTCSSQTKSFCLKGRPPWPSCKDGSKLVLALGRARVGCWTAAPTNQTGNLRLLEALCPSPSRSEGSHQAFELDLCERMDRKAPGDFSARGWP